MSKRNFKQLLEARWALGHFVCVGLDSEHGKIPISVRSSSLFDTVVNFNRQIVNETHDLVCAYKPNSAFYEALGAVGFPILFETISYIHKVAPDVPVILDAKRADIGNTNVGYVEAAFDLLGADAITVHPYLGREALQPFLDRKDKGIIVLCRTSNQGADEFQSRQVIVTAGEVPSHAICGPVCKEKDSYWTTMYKLVASRVAREWNTNGNCAVVVGATNTGLSTVRQIVGDMPILIPGIGAQGGDLEKTVAAGKDSRGQGMIINSSRGIIFASGGEDFAEAARQETLKLHNAINQCLQQKGAQNES